MELVVVLAILAVATARRDRPRSAATIDEVRARAEVAAVAAFLRAAREQAVTRGQALEVVAGSRGARAPAPARRPRRSSRRRRRARPSPRSCASTAARTPAGVTFLPQGMSSGARFGIETAGPRAYVITVDALTGRVTTQRAAR